MRRTAFHSFSRPFSGLRQPLVIILTASSALLALVGLTSLAPAAASEDVSPATHRTPPSTAASCTSCHAFDPALSHPVNIAPRSATSLPLDKGRIVCITCHDPALHRRSTASASLRNALAPAALCAACHSPNDRASHPHTRAALTAHLVTGKSRQGTRSPRGVLDSESQSCMSCHDGSLASDAGSHRALRSLDNPAEEHPIAIAYSSAGRTLSEMKLLPQSRLDPRIRLFNGSMGCGSCHSPYSRIPNQLVISNNASKLCLSCHHDR